MARHKALVTCFVDNCLRHEGEVFQYNGPKTDVLEPLDAPEEPHEEPTERKLRRKTRAEVSSAE